MTEVNPEDLARTIADNIKPELLKADRGSFEEIQFAVVPRAMEVKSLKSLLDEYRVKPDRRTGTIETDTLDSFIDVSNRFKAPESVVFARALVGETSITASLVTIFNYHPQGPDNTDAKFIDHRVHYRFPLSKDFTYWLSRNGKQIDQLGFAQFLEDRIHDLSAVQDTDQAAIDSLAPLFADPLTILELSRDLEIYSQESYRQKNKLSSGETELKFTSQHVDAGGKPIKIPDFFVIQLPLFEGGLSERVLVRLRYRPAGEKVNWWYDLYRVDTALEKAFANACETVKDETGLPLYRGAAESNRS